jgi:hypothetical protein
MAIRVPQIASLSITARNKLVMENLVTVVVGGEK